MWFSLTFRTFEIKFRITLCTLPEKHVANSLVANLQPLKGTTSTSPINANQLREKLLREKIKSQRKTSTHGVDAAGSSGS